MKLTSDQAQDLENIKNKLDEILKIIENGNLNMHFNNDEEEEVIGEIIKELVEEVHDEVTANMD